MAGRLRRGKCALDRVTADTAHELAPHGVSVVSLWPGFVRTERIDMGEAAGPPPRHLDLSTSESPRFTGRAVVALATDPDVARWTGRAVSSRDLADHYGFTDVDGRLPAGPLHHRTTYERANRPATELASKWRDIRLLRRRLRDAASPRGRRVPRR